MTTEGDFRKRPVVRWPGKFPAGTVANGNTSGMDRLPTFVASTGNPNIVAEIKQGKKTGDRGYRACLAPGTPTGGLTQLVIGPN